MLTKILANDQFPNEIPAVKFTDKKTERLQLEHDSLRDATHMVAVKRLENPNEEPKLGYWESKRFVALKVKTTEGGAEGSEVWVKVNINSLAKRLGIDKKDIKSAKNLDELLEKNKVVTNSDVKLNLILLFNYATEIEKYSKNNMNFHLPTEDSDKLADIIALAFDQSHHITKKEVMDAISLIEKSIHLTPGGDIKERDLNFTIKRSKEALLLLAKGLPYDDVQAKQIKNKMKAFTDRGWDDSKTDLPFMLDNTDFARYTQIFALCRDPKAKITRNDVEDLAALMEKGLKDGAKKYIATLDETSGEKAKFKEINKKRMPELAAAKTELLHKTLKGKERNLVKTKLHNLFNKNFYTYPKSVPFLLNDPGDFGRFEKIRNLLQNTQASITDEDVNEAIELMEKGLMDGMAHFRKNYPNQVGLEDSFSDIIDNFNAARADLQMLLP